MGGDCQKVRVPFFVVCLTLQITSPSRDSGSSPFVGAAHFILYKRDVFIILYLIYIKPCKPTFLCEQEYALGLFPELRLFSLGIP